MFVGYDERRAHLVEAGADVFLMPSRYEPCGLGQMIAQRYGTLPVVRATGGLVDTVTDGQTGFVFSETTPYALHETMLRALAAYRQPGFWKLRKQCMKLDWSWNASAEHYEDVYRYAIGPSAS